MLAESEKIKIGAIHDAAIAKMNVAYKHPGFAIELTHEEAKLLDSNYPFDN